MRSNFIAIAMIFALVGGCKIHTDPDDVQLRETSATNDAALGPDDGLMPDVSANDAGRIDMAAGEITIDPNTYFDMVRDEVCAYYARRDFQGPIFGTIGFRDEAGCLSFFDVFLRNQFALMARDVAENRAVLDEVAARNLIEFVRSYDGDPRVFPITAVGGLIRPLTPPRGACSTAFACTVIDFSGTRCRFPDDRACDGVCFPNSLDCDGVLCGEDQYCANLACVPKLQDGAPCARSGDCLNQCVGGVCGVLVAGDDCSATPADCIPGTYCSTDTLVCEQFGLLGDSCGAASRCRLDLRCDQDLGQCADFEEGSSCIFEFCPAGLRCLPVDAAASVCLARRPEGEYCEANAHCASGLYCKDNACLAQRELGQGCRSDQECTSVCKFSGVGDGACAEFEWGLADGQPCNNNSARCSMGLTCVTMTGLLDGVCRAEAKPAIGEPCDPKMPYWCEDGGACDGVTCQALSLAGEPCAANEECISGLCSDGSCFDRLAACLP